jgi:hypothetical protein
VEIIPSHPFEISVFGAPLGKDRIGKFLNVNGTHSLGSLGFEFPYAATYLKNVYLTICYKSLHDKVDESGIDRFLD